MSDQGGGGGVLLHVGYHKTGTTWLRAGLFGGLHPDLCMPVARSQIIGAIVRPRALEFDARSATAELAPALAAGPPGAVAVLSHERLSGNPHSGGYDSKEIAGRLAHVFPDARVLICIRRQPDAIVSTYKQYVLGGGPSTLTRYLHPPERGRDRIPHFDLAHFAYDRLVRHYHDLFGRERVLTLPYELLVRDPAEFSGRITDFLGVPRAVVPHPEALHVSPPAIALGPRRWLNRVFVRDRLNPAAPIDAPGLASVGGRLVEALLALAPRGMRTAVERSMSESVRDLVSGCYVESNRALRSLSGCPLEQFGYEL